jgi:hypothetical protein
VLLGAIMLVMPQRIASQPSSDLAAVLARAAGYVETFQQQLSGIVAEETYLQEIVPPRDNGGSSMAAAGPRRRRLRSDLLLVRPEGADTWTQFRDVFEVDGRPVRDRDERLAKLFLSPDASGAAQIQRIREESARYNGSAGTQAFPFIPGTNAVCGPEGPSVRSAAFSHDAADLVEARLVMFEILRPQYQSTAHGNSGDSPRIAELEQRLQQLLTAARRCYRVELNPAARADRYSVRYTPRGRTAGETSETGVAADRVHVVCLDWGTQYIVNGVGHNDHSFTAGADFQINVPYRKETAQVKGRVIVP